MPTITVRDLDTGKVIHRGWYHQLRDIWEPTAEVVAEWFGCSPDDVSCGEHDDLGDVIEIAGKPVASITHEYRRVELRRTIYAEAAE
jgi:hypothetical protein